MKKNLILLNWVLITVAALATVLSEYGILAISDPVLLTLRWLALAGLLTYAFIKKNLTTSILVAMLVGTEIGYDFPEFATNLRFLRQMPGNARTLELAHQRWGDSHP